MPGLMEIEESGEYGVPPATYSAVDTIGVVGPTRSLHTRIPYGVQTKDAILIPTTPVQYSAHPGSTCTVLSALMISHLLKGPSMRPIRTIHLQVIHSLPMRALVCLL